MALQSLRSRNLVRLLAVSIAVAMVATAGLVALPVGRAGFINPALSVAPSKFWGGGYTFVPGEVMSIVVNADAGDSVAVTIQDVSGTPTSTITIIMPASTTRTLNYTIPTNWPDGATYQVTAHDSTSGTDAGPVAFAILQYYFQVSRDRAAYLPGDTVTFGWTVVYEQNYTPAPAGTGAIQAHDSTGASLIPSGQHSITASVGSYPFTINTTETVPETGTIQFWFNDTAGLRFVHATVAFRIGTLGIAVMGVSPVYQPGDIVTATIQTRVTGVPGGGPEPDIPVVVNVTDLSTGNVVAGYSATGLTTDVNGLLTYAFVLGSTPTTGSYEISATGTAHGVQQAQVAVGFDVAPMSVFTVSVSLNKENYLSGDTITATAHVVTTETLPLTYTWTVQERPSLRILASLYGATTNAFQYPIPAGYVSAPGSFLRIEVSVRDGNGTTAGDFATTTVAYGYLSLNLNRVEYNAGDTITASYSLSSNVMTSPTYLLEVTDSNGLTVHSGPTSGGSATYTIPTPAADAYTFTVIASQGGMSAEALATATQASGYVLSVTLDRSNYVPGDTMTISYKMTTRGTSALPSQFEFVATLAGATDQVAFSGSPEGSFAMPIPADAPTGTLILVVTEYHTVTTQIVTVHVGAVNPLVADVGGVPLFAILITLLFVVLLLAVILLWRRTGMGKAPAAMEMGRPAAPPPPPPSGPSQQAAGPMSVACKHCGASIEITTSKRPIEVMCPSCGETQVVQ